MMARTLPAWRRAGDKEEGATGGGVLPIVEGISVTEVLLVIGEGVCFTEVLLVVGEGV